MHANERIWHLVQIAGQIPLPSGNIPSSNPHLKPDIAHTWGWGLTLIGALLFVGHNKNSWVLAASSRTVIVDLFSLNTRGNAVKY